MKKIIVFLLFFTILTIYSQEYDTLFTRGSSYILVPKETKEYVEQREVYPTYPDVYVTVLTGLLVFAITYAFLSIKKGQKLVEKKVDGLGENVVKLDNKVREMSEVVKEQTIIVTEISLCNNVMSRIDYKVQQSLLYLEKDDTIVKSFILKMATSAKEAIQWAIHTKLKVTEDEIRAKFEIINIDMRDFMQQIPSDLTNNIRPELRKIAKHHVDRVVIIAQDEIFNNHLNDFFTLTEQTINELVRTVVSARLMQYKPKKDEPSS